jgi:hypothetical protein
LVIFGTCPLFDARLETFRPTPIAPASVGIWQVGLDRMAHRIVARNDVFDATPTRVGSFAYSVNNKHAARIRG